MEYFEFMVVAVAGILIILALLSRKKAVYEKKEAEKKLEKTLNDLDAVYSEINSTQEELNAKYREIKVSDEKIKKLAYEDALTGMPNKAAFKEMLLHTLETLRKNEFAGIMYLDLDDFKKIDDLWGHSNCDELILDVSHRLRQNLKEDDYIARMDGDGDGFMILSQNLKSFEDFDERVKRLLSAFRFPFIASFGEAVITLSIGATMAPTDGEKVDVLLKNAALALAEAKRLGKDTYVYYSEELTAREIENIELKASIMSALKNNEFLIKYTPVFRLKDRNFDLVRVRLLLDRKEKGQMQANRFIPIVENLGFSNQVGLNSIQRICEDMTSFQNIKVIVPLSAKMLFDFQFMRQFVKIVEESNLSKERILLEIEEAVITSSFSDCSFLMEELRDRGFFFALGNFGSGKSSLEVLRDMKFSYIYISVPKIFCDREEEEARRYLRLLGKVVSELGGEIIFSNITEEGHEAYVKEVSGGLVSGGLYGDCLSSEEVAGFRVEA